MIIKRWPCGPFSVFSILWDTLSFMSLNFSNEIWKIDMEREKKEMVHVSLNIRGKMGMKGKETFRV